MNELDLLAKFRDVPAPREETMREVAVLFATETDLMPVPAKRSGKRRLAVAGGSVAAAAAVFGVASLIGSLTAPAQPQASGNARDLILAAYDDNADSIMHITITQRNGAQPPYGLEYWDSSPQAKPGETFTQREIAGPQGQRQDSSETFVVPTVGPLPANCELRALPDNRVGQELAVDGDALVVNHGTRTWYQGKGDCMFWGEEPPAQLRDQIASGQWQRVPGETTVDGQRAVEYTKVSIGDKSKGVGDTHASLWVSADSSLPIKLELKGFEVDGTTVGYSETDDYAFLPDTAENRKNLEVPIPDGYTQTPVMFPQLHQQH